MPRSSDDSDANSEVVTPQPAAPAQPHILLNEVDYGRTGSIVLKSLASKTLLHSNHEEPEEKLEHNTRETIVRTRSNMDLPDLGDALRTPQRCERTRVLRSRSDATLLDYKNEWGAAIMLQ